MKHDASQSRYLRKKHAKQGIDQQQEQQQKEFGHNLQKALDTFGKTSKSKDISSQVQYFGHMIQPFNMRQQQQMGDIDQQGYFVFKRRGEYRDAWLQSIEEGSDMMVADKVKKKIKTEGVTFKGVYDEDGKGDRADDQRVDEGEEDDGEEVQDDERLNNKNLPQQGEESSIHLNLQPSQIKQLICQLLPMNKSANAYIKQLKPNIKTPQTKQLHDKILQLCNMYIQKTNQYDILTSKKEQLEAEGGIQGEEKSEEIDWDDEGEEQKDEQQDKREGEKMGVRRDVQQRSNEINNKGDTKNGINYNIKRNKYNDRNEADEQGNYSDDDIF